MSTETTTAEERASGISPKVSPFAVEAPVIEISEAALVEVLRIRNSEPDPESLALHVEITGASGTEYQYSLCFDELSAATDDDTIVETGEISVIVPNSSVDNLRGSVLDLPRTAGQGGLVIRNPNRPNPLAGVELNLDGTIAEQVEELLEKAINPSLAAHGGFAKLVGVDDENKVYITMGGGCQGCAASQMTLTQGIQRQIKEYIPDVVDVVDATDHAAGENPFYH
ncbi:MAG: NifU family protein [Microthrixaceae bacterium]|nr:NifU family protein [Microthrixaceae bacterium]